MTILMPRAESPTIKVADIAYLRFGTFLALGFAQEAPLICAPWPPRIRRKSRRSRSPAAARSCGSRCFSSPPL